MKNKIYYGEYTLEHWIKLILKGKVVIPEYQRAFVWNEGQIKELAKSFKEDLFVPPVTVGAFKDDENGGVSNLIIDGQQRLTALLLMYLGVFPEKSRFTRLPEEILNENDEIDDVEDVDVGALAIDWQFTELVSLGNNREAILEEVRVGRNYKELDVIAGSDRGDFFKSHFLGFSYLVPSVNNSSPQKYYSSVFRNINIQGKGLSRQEARESFYYLKSDLAGFFKPSCIKGVKINNDPLDFVRYLALLSEYHVSEKSINIAQNFKAKMEDYYLEYIYSVIDNKEEGKFSRFSTVFSGEGDDVWISRIENFDNSLKLLDFENPSDSIIKSDIHFFGLIYFIIYKNNNIDDDKVDDLKKDLQKKIDELMRDNNHKKSPANLNYLRSRIQNSIDIYSRFIRV